MSHAEPETAVTGFDERGAGGYQGFAFSTRAVERMRAEGGFVPRIGGRGGCRSLIGFRRRPFGAYPKAER